MIARLRTWAYHALANGWEHHADRWFAEAINAKTSAAFDEAHERMAECRRRADACRKAAGARR